MRLVKVKNFPNRMFAEQAQETLIGEGIPSLLQSPDAGIIGPGSASILEGVDLYTDEEHAVEARALLDELFDGM